MRLRPIRFCTYQTCWCMQFPSLENNLQFMSGQYRHVRCLSSCERTHYTWALTGMSRRRSFLSGFPASIFETEAEAHPTLTLTVSPLQPAVFDCLCRHPRMPSESLMLLRARAKISTDGCLRLSPFPGRASFAGCHAFGHHDWP